MILMVFIHIVPEQTDSVLYTAIYILLKIHLFCIFMSFQSLQNIHLPSDAQIELNFHKRPSSYRLRWIPIQM